MKQNSCENFVIRLEKFMLLKIKIKKASKTRNSDMVITK